MAETWTGRRVKVKLRTENGAGYWVLGRLRAVNDEGIKLSPPSGLGCSGRPRPKRPKLYAWRFISDMRLLQDS